MGKSKRKTAKKATQAKKKAPARPEKTVSAEKTPSPKRRGAARTRLAACGKKSSSSKHTMLPARRKAVSPRPVAPKRASSGPVTPISRVLKEEITTVLVTGPRGCVGSFLVQHLVRAGYSVIAVDRKGTEIQAPGGQKSLQVRQGDLLSPTFVSSCLTGVDAVIHAGLHADGKPLYGDPGPSSVPATGILYRLARKNGVKRFILITSASLYGRHHGPLTEDVPLEAWDEYEQSQSDLESIVLEDPLPGLPSVTVIRPAPVYGPGCTAFMASLATLPPVVKTLGPYYIPLSSGPRTSLVHGEDVARAAIFLLLQPKAYGDVFNVAANDPMPFGHFVNEAMSSYGLKPLEPGVPYPPGTLLQSILPCDQAEDIFNPLSKLSNLLWERLVRTHRLNKALVTKKDGKVFPLGARDLVVDSGKLMRLGFRLKYPIFRRGWERTLAWYLKNRWIPGPDEL
jgi:nucleoside-diphosphate-sugar epimerase